MLLSRRSPLSPFFSTSCPSHIASFISNYRYVIYLFAVTYFIILPLVCVNLKYSAYYLSFKEKSQAITDMQEENLRRLIDTQKLIRDLRHDDTKRDFLSALSRDNLHGEPVEVGFTIITMSRNNLSSVRFARYQPRYLTQVLGKLIHLVSEDPSLHDRFKIYLCNVDTRPHLYTELKDLRGVVPVFQNHTEKSRQWHRRLTTIEKEKWDYIYCLRETAKRVKSYVVILEDDAYPMNDFISLVKHLVDFRLVRNNIAKNLAYVKLYHPYRVLGYWSIEYDRIPELIAFAMFFGTILLFFVKCIFSSRHLSIYVLWFMFFVYFLLFAILIGRQNLLELRRLSFALFVLSHAPQCCTPGILYTKDSAGRIADYFSNVYTSSGYAMDFALYEFPDDNSDLNGYMIQPNRLQHIGLHTTLHSTIGDPFQV